MQVIIEEHPELRAEIFNISMTEESKDLRVGFVIVGEQMDSCCGGIRLKSLNVSQGEEP